MDVITDAIDAVHVAFHLYELMPELLVDALLCAIRNEWCSVFGAKDEVYPVFAFAVCHGGWVGYCIG